MEAEPEEAGQNGSRTGGSWTEWKQNRRKLDRMDAEQEGCISCRAAGILDWEWNDADRREAEYFQFNLNF